MPDRVCSRITEPWRLRYRLAYIEAYVSRHTYSYRWPGCVELPRILRLFVRAREAVARRVRDGPLGRRPQGRDLGAFRGLAIPILVRKKSSTWSKQSCHINRGTTPILQTVLHGKPAPGACSSVLLNTVRIAAMPCPMERRIFAGIPRRGKSRRALQHPGISQAAATDVRPGRCRRPPS